MVQIMAISGITMTKIIAEVVIRSKFHTVLNTFKMYNVYCMAFVQSYCCILNHPVSILDTVPAYTYYLVLLYGENDVPTKPTFFFLY